MTNGQPSNSGIEHPLNYVTANHFYVEMEQNREIKACFSECQGLGVRVKKETYFEGGVNDQQRIILGQTEFTDVTLKRGVTNDLEFWNWLNKLLDPSQQVERRNINILLFNQAGETMQCWTLIGAVPIGWKAPGFQANGNTVALEELTLAYEGLKVMNSGGGGALQVKRDEFGYFDGN